jgi:hypothetical protein
LTEGVTALEISEISVTNETEFKDAITNASTDNASPTAITITSDIMLTSTVSLSAGRYVTIAGQTGQEKVVMGQSVSGAQRSDTAAMLMVTGNMTISDLTIDAGGYMRVITVMPEGKLTLNSGSVIKGGKLGNLTVTHGVGIRVHEGSANKYGELVVNDGARITGCRALGTYSIYGIGVFVGSYGRFTMNGGIIDDNTDTPGARFPSYGGGILLRNFGGAFTMNGGEISGNTSNGGGGGIYVENGGAKILGGEISGNTSSRGGGIYSIQTVEFSGGEIGNNVAVSDAVGTDNGNGGGVFVAGGTFTMKGEAVISGNTASSTATYNSAPYNMAQGGGVYTRGLFKMDGGQITGNEATLSVALGAPAGCGGGVAVAGGQTPGIFEMTGGSIDENTAENKGGGAYLNTSENTLSINASQPTVIPGIGKFIVSSSPVVTNNWHTVLSGQDNIFLPSGALLHVADALDTDANISLNAENSTPGLTVGEPSGDYILTALDADACKDNAMNKTIRLSGGVLVLGSPKTGDEIQLTDSIIDPISDVTYKGVRITPDPAVSLGGIILTKNIDYQISYLNNLNVGTASAIIIGTGDYDGRVSCTFQILPKDMSELSEIPITSKIYTGAPLTPALKLYNNGLRLTYGKDFTAEYGGNTEVGTAIVTATAVASGNYIGSFEAGFDILTSEGVLSANDDGSLISAIAQATGETPDVPTDIYITDSIITSDTIDIPRDKYIRLIGNSDDISISTNTAPGNLISVSGGLTLDGIVANANAKGRVVYVSPGAMLSLSEDGIVTGGVALVGAGIYNEGELYIEGGSVNGNKKVNAPLSTGKGGGIYNGASGSAVIISGDIYDNYNSQGGGVYNAGTLTLYAGSIKLNVAEGNPSNNVYGYGGGICNTGTATISEGAISGNKATESGGGIYNEQSLHINAGIVENNISTDNGGGIYTSGEFLMTGGECRNNSARDGSILFTPVRMTSCGGGVYVAGGNFDMSGGKITDNEAFSDYVSTSLYAPLGNGGGVFVANGGACTFTMSGGEITGNTAKTYNKGLERGNGGGVYVAGGEDGGTFEMQGGLVSGNDASDRGAGVFLGDCFRLGTKGHLDFKEIYGASTLNLSDNAQITANNRSDIWLTEGANSVISASLTAQTQSTGVVSEETGDASVAVGSGGYTLSTSDADVFYSAAGVRSIALDEATNTVILKAIDLSDYYKLNLNATSFVYTRTSQKPQVTVIPLSTNPLLTEGKDYTISFPKDTTNAGTKTVYAYGEGDYKGNLSSAYVIAKKSLSTVVATVPVQTYTGSRIKPVAAISITDGANTLLRGTDYRIDEYGTNITPGTGTIKVSGLGNYTGTKTITFTIFQKVQKVVAPKKLNISKISSASKRTLKVTWKKDASANGYQILLATDKKFKKGKKTVNITSYKTVTKTIKKLKSSKTYYVKIRAYKNVNGKKLYGVYGSPKAIRVK